MAEQPLDAMIKCGLDQVIGVENMHSSIDEAIARARELCDAERAV